MRVAALEDNVAYLEKWCEEQQDILDRAAGPIAYEYETGDGDPPRAPLRIVDLRESDEGDDDGAIVAFVETDHDRSVHQIRIRLNRIRTKLLSAKPAGRTAP